MSAPQTLVQAAFNRLSARLGSGLADAAASLAVLAQDAPERLRQEWELFVEEVELEAQRLDHPEYAAAQPGSTGSAASGAGPAESSDPQEQVDQLRARVARLSRLLEERA
jgi:hypothetical protein